MSFIGVTDDIALVCDAVASPRDVAGRRAHVPRTTTAYRNKLITGSEMEEKGRR